MLLSGERCVAGDEANLDVGARALREGRAEQREEGLDGGAGERGWVGAEEGGREGSFGDGEVLRHGSMGPWGAAGWCEYNKLHEP